MISVIIPIYNINKEYVDKCCDSLYKQSVKKIEYIFVDDCSTDKSGISIVKDYAKKDSRFIVCEMERNQGVAVARNQGMALANGEYIFFLDSDDWVRNGYFLDIENILKRDDNSKADFLILGSQTLGFNEEKTAMIQMRSIREVVLTKKEIRKAQIQIMECERCFPEINFGSMICKLYRKDFLKKNNLLCTPGIKKEQDCVFNLYALSCANLVKIVNIEGFNYRINEHSICHKYNENIGCIYLNTINHYYKFARDNNLMNEAYFYCFWTLNTIFDLDFFNKNNNKSLNEKIQKFKNLLSNVQYQEALKGINLKTVKFHNRVYILLLKYRQYYLYWVLYYLRYHLRIGHYAQKLRFAINEKNKTGKK